MAQEPRIMAQSGGSMPEHLTKMKPKIDDAFWINHYRQVIDARLDVMETIKNRGGPLNPEDATYLFKQYNELKKYGGDTSEFDQRIRDLSPSAEEPESTAQEPRITVADASTEMEQSPDSFLRPKRYDILTGSDVPAETLEDWDISFRKPNAHGGRIGLQGGQLVQPGVGRQGYDGSDVYKRKTIYKKRQEAQELGKVWDQKTKRFRKSQAPQGARYTIDQIAKINKNLEDFPGISLQKVGDSYYYRFRAQKGDKKISKTVVATEANLNQLKNAPLQVKLL